MTRLTDAAGTRRMAPMPVARHEQDAGRLTVLPPDEALRAARQLPGDAEMAIEDLTDEEWSAFVEAITE